MEIPIKAWYNAPGSAVSALGLQLFLFYKKWLIRRGMAFCSYLDLIVQIFATNVKSKIADAALHKLDFLKGLYKQYEQHTFYSAFIG